MSDALLTLLRPPERLDTPTNRASSSAGASPVASNLQPGTRILAQVLASTGHGQATLKVGPQAIQVRTTTPLQVGEQLNLEVTHAGRLLVLARRDGTAGTPRTIPQIASNLLRQQLPVQRSLGEALGAINTLAAASSSSPTVSRDLSNAAQQLLAALPRRQTLTDAEGLARTLRWATTGAASSPGLANLIAKVMAKMPLGAGGPAVGSSPAETADELPPLPGHRPVPQGRVPIQRELPSYDGLRQQLRGAGARIDLLALTAMFPRPRERVALASEIPVVSPGELGQVDVIGLRVAQEAIPAQREDEHAPPREGGEGEGARQHRWRVELAFDLPGLGPLEAVITLGREDEVAVKFRSRESPAAEVLQGQLVELDRRLRARGLTVDNLLAGRGLGPGGGGADQAGQHSLSPMVDERA